MVHLRINFVLFINFLSIFQVSLLETVHFTNSPNKILRANNYTTYKVEVPNGDPITIIEANTPLINKNIKFDDVENAKYSIKHNHGNKNHVVDLKTTLSMTVTPHNNNENERLPSGEEESVTSDYGNLSPEHTHQNSMKTVYSPELLEKFLKDYANKVHSTEPTIHALKPVNQEEYRDKFEAMKGEMNKYATDKYASIEALPEGENQENQNIENEQVEDDGNRRVSTTNEDPVPAGTTDIQERKHYRPGANDNNHPYNKNSGWVTLEAIPWSKSKVSKWQSSVKPQNNQGGYSYNYQGGNNNNYNRPPSRPSHYDEDNETDDFYGQRPSRPTYQNNQFYSGGGQSQNRPSYSHHSASHQSSSYNGNNNNHYDNDYRPNRPEIITDNRAPNFPHNEPNHYHESHEHNRPSYEQNRPGYDRPSGYDRPNRPSSYDQPQRPPFNDYLYSSGGSNFNNNHYYGNKDGNHPLTYPSSGAEGEWVLVSTTKGYQFPKRNGERAMIFKAQNGLSDTRKNDNKGIITAASQQYENVVSIRPPYQAGPTKTSQQQVKLTVLPLFVKNENGPYQNSHYNNNNVDMNVYKPSNYNGVIEADPSSQTIEESVAAAANANESNSITASAQKAPKKKRKHTKNYAIMRKNPGSDSTAMLAAVGAGLLPASLGLIAPIMLG